VAPPELRRRKTRERESTIKGTVDMRGRQKVGMVGGTRLGEIIPKE
jgi:hypothetical protein